jgi:hypothetical protein
LGWVRFDLAIQRFEFGSACNCFCLCLLRCLHALQLRSGEGGLALGKGLVAVYGALQRTALLLQCA